jgi:transposase-like protein
MAANPTAGRQTGQAHCTHLSWLHAYLPQAHLISDWRKPYPAAAANLEEHLMRLLNFYEYPCEHWRHLRTSNIIESPFAAVRLRTDAAKRFRTVKSGVHLIWQLLLKQEKKWLRFCGAEKCAKVLLPA